MRNIVIFPYHPDIYLLKEHFKIMKGYTLLGVISFKEDEMVLNELYKKLCLDVTSYYEMLQQCDEIILLDNYRGYEIDKYYQVMDDAIKLGIEINIAPELLRKIDLNNYYGNYKILGKLHTVDDLQYDCWYSHKSKNKSILLDIDVPVIAVMGMGKNCNKFDVLLRTKAILENDYKIATVSANSLGALFDCFTLPMFVFEELSFEDKVLRLNYYIKKLTEDNLVDALLIEIPEGIAAFERAETNHFGEYPLVFTTAISIDMMLFCMYYFEEGTTGESIDLFAKIVEGRFGVTVGGVVISKTLYEMSAEENMVIYENLDDEYVHSYYPQIIYSEKTIAISLKNSFEANNRIRKCIEKLEYNAYTI